ncbi:MAG: 30S ribosomal protein S27e [Candidatus Aenigmatarchaeota archaeon]
MSSKFLRVVCLKCRNEQIIFEKASTIVRCLNCNEIIAIPTGGKAKLQHVEVIEEITNF